MLCPLPSNVNTNEALACIELRSQNRLFGRFETFATPSSTRIHHLLFKTSTRSSGLLLIVWVSGLGRKQLGIGIWIVSVRRRKWEFRIMGAMHTTHVSCFMLSHV
jgi:hypothetical protein